MNVYSYKKLKKKKQTQFKQHEVILMKKKIYLRIKNKYK